MKRVELEEYGLRVKKARSTRDGKKTKAPGSPPGPE